MADNIECTVFVAQQIVKGVFTLSERRKGRSNIWAVFAEIKYEDGTFVKDMVWCRTCKKVLKYAGNQTSNLNRHKCFRATKEPVVLKKVTPEDKKTASDACMQWIVEDCHSNAAVSGTGFEQLARCFIKIGAYYGKNVDIKDLLPHPMTISSEILNSAAEKKIEFRNTIIEVINSGGASATVDMWTDNYVQRNFLGITLHYQREYKLYDMILGIKSMDFERSTSEHILKKLKSLFAEFGVENIDNIAFITNSEMNIVNALQHYTRLNCSSHLLAKVLEKSFDETLELSVVLQSCRKIVKYFKEANLQYRLPTSTADPCPTRWNANFNMFKSIVDNWYNINEILTQTDEGECLLQIDTLMLKSLVEFLKDIDTIFKKLQLCNSPSLCFVMPSIYKIKALCAHKSADMLAMSAFKAKILKNVENIWFKNLSLYHKAAFFLYPPAAGMQQADLMEIKNFCVSAMQKFSTTATTSQSACASPSPADTVSSTNPHKLSTTSIRIDDVCSLSNMAYSEPSSSPKQDIQFFFPELLNDTRACATSATPREEVDRYSKELVKLTEDFDLLEWWKYNSTTFPLLSNLALQIHSMPASSAAAEISHSMAGNIITEKRNILEPKVADSLLFLHSYNKHFNE